MQRALTLYQTSIGKKVAMAASGVIIVGFAVGHMAGNLQAYAGAEQYNAYAEALKANVALLWAVRIVLLVAFGTHIVTGITLTKANRAARPVQYKVKPDIAADYASKTMPLTGITLLCFLIFHLATLTGGQTLGGALTFDPANAYANMVGGFQVWWISLIYILGNIALGMHLFHGVYSIFQSLGLNHPRYNEMRESLAVGVATLVTLGNISFPITVMLGKLG